MTGVATGDESDILGEPSISGFHNIYQSIVFSRNSELVKKIEKNILKSEAGNFFAVGALHLIGDDGVINLLKKDGFEVKRICN